MVKKYWLTFFDTIFRLKMFKNKVYDTFKVTSKLIKENAFGYAAFTNRCKLPQINHIRASERNQFLICESWLHFLPVEFKKSHSEWQFQPIFPRGSAEGSGGSKLWCLQVLKEDYIHNFCYSCLEQIFASVHFWRSVGKSSFLSTLLHQRTQHELFPGEFSNVL